MKEISIECAEAIIRSIKTSDKLKSLSNDELADILTETLWAKCPLMSPQSDLLNEVIDRLKRIKNE